MQELGQTPFTPAVSTFFALETALDELAEQGGVPARREVYRQRNLRIRRVLTSLGFQSFTNTGRESVTISTVKVPPGVDVQALYDQLKERGFVIYKAKGPLAADHIQIANMGEIPECHAGRLPGGADRDRRGGPRRRHPPRRRQGPIEYGILAGP